VNLAQTGQSCALGQNLTLDCPMSSHLSFIVPMSSPHQVTVSPNVISMTGMIFKNFFLDYGTLIGFGKETVLRIT
jgi:hypothetical protein